MLDKVPIVRIFKAGKEKPKRIKDTVAAERTLTIIVDHEALVTLLCSPEKLEYLAAGFLYSEGLIKGKADIGGVVLDEKRGVIEIATAEPGNMTKDMVYRRIIGSSGGRGISPPAIDYRNVESTLTITPVEIFGLIEEFIHRSEVYESTGGVHSAALCDSRHIIVFSEDIGRHNAIDKVFEDRIVVTSGRVSSEIVHKVVKRDIPMLISKSAPTNKGVELAADVGITLIGFVREGRMNVYTHNRRVVSNGT
jgi:FdhD protein